MKGRATSGWVLSFSSEEALLEAVRKLVKEDGARWEVCAPYPCAAVRLANRHAGRAVGAQVRLWAVAGGVCGFVAVALWIYWTQFDADLLVTQGRVQGWDSWPAYVPALFEGTILGAGLLTAAGFLKGAVLPKWNDWAFECDFFRTDEHGNGYFILLEGGGEGECAALADSLNPAESEHVRMEGGGVMKGALAAVAVLVLLAAGWFLSRDDEGRNPVPHLFDNMNERPLADAQQVEAPSAPAGRRVRPVPPHTVAWSMGGGYGDERTAMDRDDFANESS